MDLPNRHSKIENEWSNVDRVGVDYVYDSLGRVSTRELFGNITDAYGTTIDKVRDTFTYNDRNEMTHVETHVRQSSVYQELVARDHLLVYDAQGNRTSHQRNGHATTYEVNSLNQYTSRDNTNYLAVEGTSTNATVKVYETGQTETTATRKDRYYYRDWSLGSSVDDYPEINVKEGTTVTYTGKAWIPGDEWEENDAILYDDNGNLTKDALWNYTYDDENRLVKMEETTGAAFAGFPDTTITFKYDYMCRRAEKKVMRGMSTESHLRFVWKGWMLIAELNVLSSNALLKTYTWGPDISGGFAAGGNGGVLLVKDHVANESFYPAYDKQGNVYGLIDMSGNLDAEYEYDPFGKLIRYSGPRKTSMSLLYSTKYTDMESGLIYYGHRYYDPRQGRFINRDPIGESGGINLYGMVGNNQVNVIDYLGLCGSKPKRPTFIGSGYRESEDYEDRMKDYEEELKEWKDCNTLTLSGFETDGDAAGVRQNVADNESIYKNGTTTPNVNGQKIDTGNESNRGNTSPGTGDETQKDNEDDGPDCDELRRKYPDAFIEPGQLVQTNDPMKLAAAAGIRAGIATRNGIDVNGVQTKWEFDAFVRDYSTDRLSLYSFGNPTPAPTPYGGTDRTKFPGIVLWAHSHDVDISGDPNGAAKSEAFSAGDRGFALNPTPIPAVLHTPTNNLLLYDPTTMAGENPGQIHSGRSLGIPSQDVGKIMDCIENN